MLHDAFGLIGRIVDATLRIDRVAGAGGFSVVYRAFHIGLREWMAVKCLHMPGGLSTSTERRIAERFSAEGMLQGRLAHRGIARTLGAGATRATTNLRFVPFVVLEWLDGRTLSEEIRQRADQRLPPFTLLELVDLLDGAIDGLAHAHTLGVVHRDVKPRNLFVLDEPRSSFFRTKLIDFGAVKLIRDHALGVGVPSSGGGAMALSLPYAAPEQFDRAVGAMGPWTDVYSLALTLLEGILGRRVVHADHYQAFGAAALDQARRPTPRSLGLQCSEEVEEVFRKAVAVAPDERWGDAGVFWGTLKHVLRGVNAGDLGRRESRIEPPPDTLDTRWVDTVPATPYVEGALARRAEGR
jgi:eukaryotic-like serine/threonine-protein kinase